MKGITKRWVLNTFGVILIILFVLIAAFAAIVQSFYYNGIFQTLNGRSSELVNMFNEKGRFTDTARDYVENFPDKELMELMVIDDSGKPVITSTGFTPEKDQTMPDYTAALDSESNYADWHGKISSGENVMALTRVITDRNGKQLGAIRYVVSLEEADRKIFISITLVCLIGILIMFFIFISSTYFLGSIVRPVREISETAKRIAQGDFEARIDKFYDDEIGDLCDTINYMAGELGTADRMKNDFISSVSHELRTPLTAIKGWAETMQLSERGTLDRRTFDRGMGVIIKESSRLTGIVEELLDFGRIQSGRMVLINEKIDIIAEFDETVYMLKERAAEEGIHLLYDEDDTVYYPPVYGDRNRLRQVFLNVLDNALKYTPKGGVVAAQVIYTKDDPDVIKIVVTDSGCGISAEDLPRVKEKFYKANQKVGGSGIGLAVADEIMNLHHGSLNIESGEGVGTTVTLTLPVYKDGDENQSETKNIKL